jgi:hypothetical protein
MISSAIRKTEEITVAVGDMAFGRLLDFPPSYGHLHDRQDRCVRGRALLIGKQQH